MAFGCRQGADARTLGCDAPQPGIKHVVRRANACLLRRAGALVGFALTSERGVMWLVLSAPLERCIRHPTGSHPPSVAGCPSPEQVRSTPGERLPVPAGWRCGEVGVEWSAGRCLAWIKCIAWVLYAPPHGQPLSLCCYAPKPGIKCAARRASACPSRRAGAVLTLVLNGERGVVWLALSALLACCLRHPTGWRAPSVGNRPGRVSTRQGLCVCC